MWASNGDDSALIERPWAQKTPRKSGKNLSVEYLAAEAGSINGLIETRVHLGWLSCGSL